jgi:hypothetical protein
MDGTADNAAVRDDTMITERRSLELIPFLLLSAMLHPFAIAVERPAPTTCG